MKENLIDINRLKRFKVKLDNRYPILEDGIIPEKYMPSYVDDVLEFDTLSSFPTTGESGKIYLTADTNKSYRWAGSGYAEISSSLALGETSATAYRGDRGKIAYDHSQKSHSLTIAGNSVSALGGTLTKDTLLTSLGLSSAASDITSLKAHVANGDIHVTADDKTTWNSAVETLDTHTKDTTIHITSDERTKWNNNIANLSTHIADSTKHITASERKAWNAKWDYNEATIKAVKVNNATTADKVGHTLTFADGTTFNGSADKSIGKAQVGLDKVENKTITVTSSSVSDGTNTFNKYIHPTHSAVTIASANGRVLGNISVDSLGHVTSVGYKALGFADIPSLYIGKTKIQSSSAAQALTGISSITLEGSTAELKWDDDKSAWRLSGNLLVDGFVASGGTGSSGGSSGGAVDVSYVANLTAGTLLGTLTINGTDYQILAPSLTASSINAALGNTPVARATADAEGNSISGMYAKTSSLPTKVSQLTNDSGYLTGITKAMVESVLTGEITSHTHTFESLTSKPTTLSGYGITNGLSFQNDNENYLAARFINNDDFAKKAASKYIELWQGDAGYFNLMAGKYIVAGGTSSHFLKGDGSLDPTAYLPLSGGTISSSSSTPININSTGSESGIRFYLNSTAKGGIWYNPNYGTYLYTYTGPHKLGLKDDGNGYIDSNIILHSGNFNSYSPKLNGTGATGYWNISVMGSANCLNPITMPTTSMASASPFIYAKGQLVIGTAEGNCYEGSSNDYNLWSFPNGGTWQSDTIANIQSLRLSWDKSSYWHDIFCSPNNDDLWHRAVIGGTAKDWHRIVEERTDVTYGINISGTADNADTLDGVHYQNILERTNSGSSYSGTATGWFRIAETLGNDSSGYNFLLSIQRSYFYTNNESPRFK